MLASISDSVCHLLVSNHEVRGSYHPFLLSHSLGVSSPERYASVVQLGLGEHLLVSLCLLVVRM